MRRITGLFLLTAFLFLIIPAAASTWRSTSGNIFNFQPNGGVTVYHPNGTQTQGKWWWITQNSRFGYTLQGYQGHATVTIQQGGAVVQWPGQQSQHWTQIAEK
jgi:Tfp pilus assembly protein FimT